MCRCLDACVRGCLKRLLNVKLIYALSVALATRATRHYSGHLNHLPCRFWPAEPKTIGMLESQAGYAKNFLMKDLGFPHTPSPSCHSTPSFLWGRKRRTEDTVGVFITSPIVISSSRVLHHVHTSRRKGWYRLGGWIVPGFLPSPSCHLSQCSSEPAA